MARGTSALSLRSASAASLTLDGLDRNLRRDDRLLGYSREKKLYGSWDTELVFIAAGIAPSKKGSRVA